jgi:hypothetical protein
LRAARPPSRGGFLVAAGEIAHAALHTTPRLGAALAAGSIPVCVLADRHAPKPMSGEPV